MTIDYYATNQGQAALSDFPSDPIVHQGDSGAAIVELQQLLNIKGANLIVDGLFGPATKAAVSKFQRNAGLQPDGVVGPQIWAELRRPEPPIRMVDVCRYYNPSDYPHQTVALEWLQRQIPAATLREFARRWRTHHTPT